MIKIEMSPNDQKDIIEMLVYAYKMNSKEIKKKWSNADYWKIRIPQLIEVMKGKNEPIISRSSFNFERIHYDESDYT